MIFLWLVVVILFKPKSFFSVNFKRRGRRIVIFDGTVFIRTKKFTWIQKG